MVSRAGQRATVFRERLRLDWRRFEKFMQLLFHNKLAVAGLVIILVFIFISVAAPLLVGSYPSQFDRTTSLQPPSTAHPFGTDWQGFDVLKLVVYGGPVSPPLRFCSCPRAMLAGTPP